MFVKDIPRTDLDGRIEDEDNGAGTKADTVPTSTIPTSIFIEANIARDLVLARKKKIRGRDSPAASVAVLTPSQRHKMRWTPKLEPDQGNRTEVRSFSACAATRIAA